jgi:hypothetical protein
VLDGVLRERLERLADALTTLLGQLLQRRRVLDLAAGDDLAVAQDVAAAQDDGVALGQLLEQRRAGHVDQVDARLGEQQRPSVGVAIAHGACAVDDGLDAGRDQVLRRDSVELGVIDDRDVTGLQSLDEELRALSEPHDATHFATRSR